MKMLLKAAVIFCCITMFSTLSNAASTIQVSKDTSDGAPNGYSSDPAISADGRYVVFKSTASDLVSGDTNGLDDIFLYDTQLATTERINLGYAGQLNDASSSYPSISGDGKYITFSTSSAMVINYSGHRQIYVHDREGTPNNQVLVSANASETPIEANGDSNRSALSNNGRYIAFESYATDLLSAAGDDTGGKQHIYVRDMDPNEGWTAVVTNDGAGGYGNGSSYYPSLSANGEYVTFYSNATNLVSGVTDSNGKTDVFVYYGPGNTMELISKAYGTTNQTANGRSSYPHISGNGRYVAFVSEASNLVNNDTNDAVDIFFHDRQTDMTEIVSLDPNGAQVSDNGYSGYAGGLSADGRYVTFSSASPNLVEGDTNGVTDLFLRDMYKNTTVRIGLGNGGEEPDRYIYAENIGLTSDGLTAVFSTGATNFPETDTGGFENIFMRKDGYVPPAFPWNLFLPSMIDMKE